jgi:hypothetical protein
MSPGKSTMVVMIPVMVVMMMVMRVASHVRLRGDGSQSDGGSQSEQRKDLFHHGSSYKRRLDRRPSDDIGRFWSF